MLELIKKWDSNIYNWFIKYENYLFFLPIIILSSFVFAKEAIFACGVGHILNMILSLYLIVSSRVIYSRSESLLKNKYAILFIKILAIFVTLVAMVEFDFILLDFLVFVSA